MADRKDIEKLFREHYRQLYRQAMILLHDEAESKDVVHDVFAKVLTDETELREDTAWSFFMTSVRNRCLNLMRNRKTQERIQRLYLLDIDTTLQPSAAHDEDIRRLQEGIALLEPPVCHEVIVSHFREGQPFREIAQRLQVSETTVYKYLRHALNQLRSHLKDR